MGTSWSETSFKVRAVVYFVNKLSDNLDGATSVNLDVIQFISEFPINDIPSATLLVALGRNANDVNTVSSIHTHFQDVRTMLPAKVYVTAISASGSPKTDMWPSHEFLAFEGYATGGGYRKSAAGAEYYLYLTHWLVDLNFSSALTRTAFPFNASSVSYWASVPFAVTTGGQAKDMTFFTTGAQFFTPDVIQADLWGFGRNNSNILPATTSQAINAAAQAASSLWELGGGIGAPSAVVSAVIQGAVIGQPQPVQNSGGLKRLLLELTLQDRLANNAIVSNLYQFSQINIEAQRALYRFEPFGDNNVYEFGLPISLYLPDPSAATNIANSIANDVAQSRLGLHALSGITIWDLLLGILSEYHLMIVPMIDRALVVPYNPILRAPYWRTLWANNLDRVEMTAKLIRPIRGVFLFSGRGWGFAGASTSGTPLANNFTSAGNFNGGVPDGLMLFKHAPMWLTGIAPGIAPGPNTNVNLPNAISTAVGMGSQAALTAVQGTSPNNPQNILAAMHPVLNQYAKAAYATEALRERQGTFSGRVRFDIAPGSQVRVQIPGIGDPALGDLFQQTVYGMVMKVTTAINAETSGAGTSFLVGYIRSEKENFDDSLSLAMSVHPIWRGLSSRGIPYAGAPLSGVEAAFNLPDECMDMTGPSVVGSDLFHSAPVTNCSVGL